MIHKLVPYSWTRTSSIKYQKPFSDHKRQVTRNPRHGENLPPPSLFFFLSLLTLRTSFVFRHIVRFVEYYPSIRYRSATRN